MKVSKLLHNFSTKSGNPKNYDIVIVGANAGGVLSRHLKNKLQNQFNIYVVYDKLYNQRENLNVLYEQGALKSENYISKALSTMNQKQESSDGVGVENYVPEKNLIRLTNGQEINYRQLIISTDLEQDLEQIEGLQEALADNGHPVFGSYVNSTNPVDSVKKNTHYFTFKGGRSYFYIPPFPFSGEGAHYNFLAAFDTWKQNQQQFLSKQVFKNQDIEFEILNANSSFSQHSKGLDQFIISELEKRGIKYTLNAKVTKIHKDDRQITVVNSDKSSSELEYDSFYTIIPSKKNQKLIDAQLSTEQSNYLLDVNEKTLQHNQHKNIFGLGDICNLPTTRSYTANQYQINIVRNNVIRNITGQYLNAFYQGETKIPLYISKNKLTWYKHSYGDAKGFLNLFGSNGGVMSSFNYYTQAYVSPATYQLYQQGYLSGPPYQLWLNSYGELDKIPQDQIEYLERSEKAIFDHFQVKKREQATVQIQKGTSNIKQEPIKQRVFQQSQESRQQQQEQKQVEKEEVQQQQEEQLVQQQRQETQEEIQQRQSSIDKYTNIESINSLPKRKRGRPKKAPGDQSDYTSE